MVGNERMSTTLSLCTVCVFNKCVYVAATLFLFTIVLHMFVLSVLSREVMESHEVTYNKKTMPVRAICNLNGHLIEPHRIHAGVSVPNVDSGDGTKMRAGQIFAIETFGSTGIGFVGNTGASSHFMRPWPGGAPRASSGLTGPAKALLGEIDNKFGTLAFCPRWFDHPSKFEGPLGELVGAGVVAEYPPLCDVEGSYTAQYEHTIAVTNSGVRVITRGPDY